MPRKIQRFQESQLLIACAGCLALAISLLALPSRAEHVIRLEAGVFNGKIQSSYGGKTYPFNAANGTYANLELEKGGPRWRWLVGGSFQTYTGLHFNSATDGATPLPTYSNVTSSASNNFSEFRLGGAYATKWVEWRLIYSRLQTPMLWNYTFGPLLDANIPFTAWGDYARLEAIMYAKASVYRLAFHYYFAVTPSIKLPDTVETPVGAQPVGGNATSDYFLGGCIRIFTNGDKFRIGPSICVDLQQLELPGQVVNRQEVSARLTAEF